MGWQAKYYEALSSSEWNNIKASLFNAVDTHPRLTQYYICVPHNLSDSGKGRKTQKSIWEEYKKTWVDELAAIGRNIDLILWNSTTLFSKLLLSQNNGIKTFFFSQIEIKSEELFLHLDAAIDNLGPKYSRDLNFKLDYLPTVFDALSRNTRFEESFKNNLDSLLLNLNEVISDCSRFEETKQFIESLKARQNELIGIYEKTDFSPLFEIPAAEYLKIIEETNEIVSSLSNTLKVIEEKYREELKKKAEADKKEPEHHQYHNSKTRSETDQIYKYWNETENMKKYLNSSLMRAANEGILFLKGGPGTGKSHLLADVALERKSAKIPTIFLLGEHFPNSHPKLFIQQTLTPNHSLKDYLSSLESLAKTRKVRLLFIIDAINEANGKNIWKNSIAGLVTELKQFKWIGFVFSYRTTYEHVIIPDNFNHPTITHEGFEGMEYEATKKFFQYYKIQQPAVPILNPEFSNPLFLKTFCLTLNKAGKITIPEGYEGVSKVLEEYIDAVNKNIGERLNYPYRKINLVSKAISELMKLQISTDNYIVSWNDAYLLIEPLLKPYTIIPGFLEELIKEGLLIEDYFYNHTSLKYEQHGVVFNYERFNEHLKAIYLLDRYHDKEAVLSAFASGGELRALFYDRHGFSGLQTGLLNAFAIILPERFNLEIYDVFTDDNGYVQKHIYDAFLQSTIWRKHDTIKPESWNYVREQMRRTEEDTTDFYNTILLLAANPANYYNANFIHDFVKNKSIAERDYIWSINIDKLWQWYPKNSIKRIIDWCWSDEDKSYTKDDSIVLLGKILAWLFTNSNRHIRDRATKAFACLFIDRTHLLKDFIEEFRLVNDPYVLERIIAGSFGAVVHSSDKISNAQVAQYVYDEFFSDRKPPLNILTRDYCKGLIEFVSSKGIKLNLKKENLYPPFDYDFPTEFPGEEFVKSIEIEKEGPYTEEERGQAQIPHSVLHWDFARYILGTNHGSSIPFLNYTIKSRKAYEFLKTKLRGNKAKFFKIYINTITMINGTSDFGKRLRQISTGVDFERWLQTNEAIKNHSYNYLKEKLEVEDWNLFLEAQNYISSGFETRKYNKKRFNVDLVQRYILKKVFDLGWDRKFFGKYDSNVDSNYRNASKPERIGKKYQWIAYYEIMALLSDNYDFSDRYSDNNAKYMGTWQHNFRNIDPTCISRQIRLSNEESNNWWVEKAYSNWKEDRETWLKRFDDMPDFEKIITLKDQDGEEWYLLYDRIVWHSPKQMGKERYKSGRKELWIDVKALIVEKKDKLKIFNSGSDKLYWLDTDTSEILNYYDIFLGELYYSDAYREQTKAYFDTYPFTSFRMKNKSVKVIPTVEEYRFSDEYDLSEEKISIYKPSQFLFELLNAQIGKNDACLYDKSGNIIGYDIGAFTKQSPNSFIIKRRVLDECLAKNNLEMIWFYCGEKEDIGPNVDYVYRMLFSGFLTFINNKFQFSYYHELQK
ncbi:MAG TPA: AVAST type 2 anti-phage system protein Avs2 [Chitinophagaceae bacterium]|nr:AVAST type 2 anti-phage system protein Avs2 [Chitinophagaceae bacterium]